MAATTDINTVIYAANDLFRQVTGIKRVFNEAPDVGPSADLPCVIPIASRIEQADRAQSYLGRRYQIKYLLLVSHYNKDLYKLEKLARPFADEVMEIFFQHGTLNTSPDIITDSSMESGDYGSITYNEDQTYIGWTFSLWARVHRTLTRDV